MTKKETAIKEIKQAKTIKVKTLLLAIAFVAVALGSFISGWFIRSDFDSTIKAQVSSQVRELTAVKE